MVKSTSRSASQNSQQVHPGEHRAGNYIRCLVAQCKDLASYYQTTPTVVLERVWWQSLYKVGVSLRDKLEEYRDCWDSLCLTYKEVEQAYFTLIHIAYFFEPGGVAEVIFQEQGWVWSDDE